MDFSCTLLPPLKYHADTLCEYQTMYIFFRPPVTTEGRPPTAMLEIHQQYDSTPGNTPENSINMWLVIDVGVMCVTNDTSAGRLSATGNEGDHIEQTTPIRLRAIAPPALKFLSAYCSLCNASRNEELFC